MKLNIGCGYQKIPGFINIDSDPVCRPDLIRDITKGLPYANGAVDHIYTAHCLEHIQEWEKVVVEFCRVLKDYGTLEIRVPYYPSGVAVFGMGHVRFFTPETFFAFTDPRCFQPSKAPKRCAGMFDMTEEITINSVQSPREKDGFLDTAPWRNAPCDAELVVKMKKTPKSYWMDKGVCNDNKKDVLGCFWCFAPLSQIGANSKECPGCGQLYTFGEGVLNEM